MLPWPNRSVRSNRLLFLISSFVALYVISTWNPRAVPILPSLDLAVLNRLSSHNQCPLHPPNPSYKPGNRGQFDWSNVPVKYPVDQRSLIRLPKEEPAELRRIQFDFPTPSPKAEAIRQKRKIAVREAFWRGWSAYKEYAWGMDEIGPLSGEGKQTLGGWAATMIDNLDTLWIMGMPDEFNLAVAGVANISFDPESTTHDPANLFETIIRNLGGLLSAYDLTGCREWSLLEKAIELGEMIYKSFDTPNRMPVTRFSLSQAANGDDQPAARSGLLAEIGSANIELTRLSQVTGDMKYFDAISRIANIMDEQQNSTLLPGLWPENIDVSGPNLRTGQTFSLGAGADSAYEYLGKMFQLLGGQGEALRYRKMYEYAMDTAIQNLFFRPMTPDKADILVPADLTIGSLVPPRLANNVEHLTCFVGGMLLLGGKLFDNQTHLDVGRQAALGCAWAYKNMPTGIMPENAVLRACPTMEPCEFIAQEPAPHQMAMPPGFTYVKDPRYLLRPEAIESIFYLWRITGDPKLQDVAWEMFEAIDKYTRTDYGNAQILHVLDAEPMKTDSMESFWMGETLKYFYLMFSDPDLVSLDDFVFNTEAHPMRLRR